MARPRRKNSWKTVAIILVIGILGYAGYLLYQKIPVSEPAPETAPVTSEAPDKAVVTAVTKKIVEEEKQFEINVAYPELKGLPKAIATRANKTLKDTVDAAINSFKEHSVAEPGVLVPEKSALDITFDPALTLTDKTVTVVFTVSDYFGGAAHPNTYKMPVTISQTTGLRMKTADFFKADTKYLQALAEQSSRELKAKLGDEFEASGATPTEENYEHVYLTESAVMVIFNPYQVAPYAAGIIEIKIPKKELPGLLQ